VAARDWSGLAAVLGPRLKLGEPLSRHTSFKIGGPAEAWAEPHDEAELSECLAAARALGAPVTLLSGGTNVLVLDGGIPGLVLSLDGGFSDWSRSGTTITAGAAMNLALLARKCSLAGLGGLAWAVGIPGSLAGGLVMNAGAHGGELKQVVRSVSLLLDGRPQRWDAADCGFAYRHSRFKELEPGRLVLTGAVLELRTEPVEALKRTMEEALAKRKASQPLDQPNAGCVFKNPEGASAGRLIEEAGLKGRRLGGAMISDKHANFVVNLGGAKAQDVLGLMRAARDAVRERAGVELKDEILVLGVEA
jgi:UDP-N-acetylmuramate dehydrogenase